VDTSSRYPRLVGRRVNDGSPEGRSNELRGAFSLVGLFDPLPLVALFDLVQIAEIHAIIL
jgi:hypothetical protein